MQLSRENERFLGRAGIDREEFSYLGKIGEAGIERDQQLQPARDFEKRPIFSQNRLRPLENVRGGKDGSGNVNFPALPWIVGSRGS